MDSKFTRKALLVVGGHNIAPPYSITYFSVVTRDIVKMKFIIDFMNDLYICACKISNAYLNAPYQGKMWIEVV